MESGTVQLQDIFLFQQEGLDKRGMVTGRFKATGFIPTFYEDLRRTGFDVDLRCFDLANDSR